MVCTDWGAGHSEFLDVNLVAVDIQPGEEVTCFWEAGPAGAIDVVALTDPPDIEGMFVFNDVRDAPSEATISLTSGTPHTFLDLRQGSYPVTLVEQSAGLVLRTIECHHPKRAFLLVGLPG